METNSRNVILKTNMTRVENTFTTLIRPAKPSSFIEKKKLRLSKIKTENKISVQI